MQIKQVQLKLPGLIVKKKSPKCCQNIFLFKSSCRQPTPLWSSLYFLSIHPPNDHRWSLNQYEQGSITDIQRQYSALHIALIACSCMYVVSKDILSFAAACGSRICFRHTTAAVVQAHVCLVLSCRRSPFLKGQERDSSARLSTHWLHRRQSALQGTSISVQADCMEVVGSCTGK